MKRLARRSKGQLAFALEHEARHDLTPEQESALLLALSDLLLEAVYDALPEAKKEPGESHEP